LLRPTTVQLWGIWKVRRCPGVIETQASATGGDTSIRTRTGYEQLFANLRIFMSVLGDSMENSTQAGTADIDRDTGPDWACAVRLCINAAVMSAGATVVVSFRATLRERRRGLIIVTPFKAC
jgi:hypothetical protein